jgi:hypothetical protein
MQIVRTETPSGGPDRTRRESIVPLNTGPREVEPEVYMDASESEGWPWDSDPGQCTWLIQLYALRGFITPFEQLDSQAAAEQAGGSDEEGGVYTYPFSNRFLPIGEGDDDGDLNSSNWSRKWQAFAKTYFGGTDRPQHGGTVAMAAVAAGDEHFLGEFGPGGENEAPRDQRPVRARVMLTDGALSDESTFRGYLAQATLDKDTGYGRHGEWDEVWAIAIFGETGGAGGKAAYSQYLTLSADHPWVHAYYFEGVTNPDEIAEDMALAVVPTGA